MFIHVGIEEISTFHLVFPDFKKVTLVFNNLKGSNLLLIRWTAYGSHLSRPREHEPSQDASVSTVC